MSVASVAASEATHPVNGYGVPVPQDDPGPGDGFARYLEREARAYEARETPEADFIAELIYSRARLCREAGADTPGALKAWEALERLRRGWES